MTVPTSSPPYPPGWADRLLDLVGSLPLPYPLFYLGLALLAFAAQTAVKWWDGSYPVGQFYPFHLLYSVNFAVGLGVLHYLREAARRRFARFRPYLKAEDAEAELERYRLTTAPAGWALLAGLAAGGWGLFQHYAAPASANSLLFTSPQASVVDMALLLLFWWTVGGVIHWLLHYFRTSSRLYQNSTADLLQPQGLYTFSTLSLRVVVGATLLNYAYVYFAPKQSLQLGDYLACALIELVAVAAFVLPAWGIHRMLLQEKLRLHDQVHARIERLVTQLYLEIDLGSYQQMGSINQALVALQTEHALVERTSTWPWPSESPRLLATAILVPLLLWLAQRLLEHFLG